MTEMEKRVAKAMKEVNDATGAEDEAIFEASWQTLARAAIEAMREPTVQMEYAAECEILAQYELSPQWDDPKDVVENINVSKVFRVMIDAALKESKRYD